MMDPVSAMLQMPHETLLRELTKTYRLEDDDLQILWYLYAHEAAGVSRIAAATGCNDAKHRLDHMRRSRLIMRTFPGDRYELRSDIRELLAIQRGIFTPTTEWMWRVYQHVPVGRANAVTKAEIQEQMGIEKDRFQPLSNMLKYLWKRALIQRGSIGQRYEHRYVYWRDC